MAVEFATIIDALHTHEQSKPQDVAFKFRSADQETSITWAELAIRARTLAAIISKKTSPGDRALLVYAPGIEFISAFLAGTMAGVISIPCFPPTTEALKAKFVAIITDAQPSLMLHDNSVETSDVIDSINTTSLASDKNLLFSASIKKENIAFLQYSSGSTGEPKGVMISHQNIVANINHIAKVCGANEDTRGLCWMPHTHDMGLIGHILSGIYLGYYLCLVSPSQMIRHPLSILKLLTEERLDSLGMPNFACELCIKRIKPEQLKELNLSHLKTVIVGAEPINEAVLKEFAYKFSSVGFESNMFLSAYGLAETTLMASAHRGLDTHLVKAKEIVNCGQAIETLKIVNPDSLTECAENEIGEIWLAGPSVAKGYWNKLELTKHTFQSKLPNDHRNYLRTGDLGYMKNGNLFVCGRLKEMMIFTGEKYFPQDIEKTILESDAQLEQQDCVAFATHDKDIESLTVIVKVQRNADDLMHKKFSTKIRKAIVMHHQLSIKEIVFVTNTMPRTTSGKKQRVYCQQLYESHQLEKYFKLTPFQEKLYAETSH